MSSLCLWLEGHHFFHVFFLANCSTRLFLVVASMPGECFTVHSIFQSLHWLVGSYYHAQSDRLEHPFGSGWSKCVSDMQWVWCFFFFGGGRVFSCNLSCRSLWHFKRTCLDFFWNNKAANEENMKDSGRFRNSIDFQVEIVIVCQNKPTSSIRSTSILFQTTKIWSPSPPWPASFIQWKAPKLAIPPWV